MRNYRMKVSENCFRIRDSGAEVGGGYSGVCRKKQKGRCGPDVARV